MANVLVIGAGGREHALCWKLSQSENVSKIYASPGNAGTSYTSKVTNIGEYIFCNKFEMLLIRWVHSSLS